MDFFKQIGVVNISQVNFELCVFGKLYDVFVGIIEVFFDISFDFEFVLLIELCVVYVWEVYLFVFIKIVFYIVQEVDFLESRVKIVGWCFEVLVLFVVVFYKDLQVYQFYYFSGVVDVFFVQVIVVMVKVQIYFYIIQEGINQFVFNLILMYSFLKGMQYWIEVDVFIDGLVSVFLEVVEECFFGVIMEGIYDFICKVYKVIYGINRWLELFVEDVDIYGKGGVVVVCDMFIVFLVNFVV